MHYPPMMNFRLSGYHHYEGFARHINDFRGCRWPPHYCRLAPHQLPPSSAICSVSTAIEN